MGSILSLKINMFSVNPDATRVVCIKRVTDMFPGAGHWTTF
jgi:hypothetical protein